MENFVHLHNHTEFSLLDGAVRVNDLIHKAKEYNMPAVAITDHGVLYGMYNFYKKAQKEGVKPLLGCEIYLSPDSRFKKDSNVRYHLLLLAANNNGYHNLINIVSKAWLEGFYYKPRADKELLYENREGIIALSACIQGEIPQKILYANEKEIKKTVKEYQEIFADNFYLELQDHHLREEKKVNANLIKLANEENIPLVITNDVHYKEKRDAALHEILLALQTGKTIYDEDRMTFPNNEFYFKSPKEMKALFPDLDDAYNNTVEISEKCNVNLEYKHFFLPDYPETDNPRLFLRKLCRESLERKELSENKTAQKRLDYELNIIEKMGYSSYFLIVYDFISYAKENDIRVGPGRGSAAGSLVSYLLGITKINPLDYGLIFERFLNPERVTMPDIDIDFDEQRDKIIDYVKRRYGEEKVAQIGTFGTMAARAAIRDVGRAMALPYKKVDKIAKMIPARPGLGLDEAMDINSSLQDVYNNDEEIHKLIDMASGIEGMPRHISTHAAGVIIGSRDLIDLIPLQIQDENIITQLPMNELEEMGLLKMDFLGLRNLTVIDKALNLIKKNHSKKINIDEIPLDDRNVYKMLSEGKTLGVFQMESHLFQDLNKRLHADNFNDLIALLALGRPGPLGSNMVKDFIEARHGKKEPEYLHPLLEPILKDTFGLILYQEQVMEIASKLASYTMGEADLLRRGMGKKKKKLIAQERDRFIKGAVEKGIKKATANMIFDQMEYFAGYGFNKSHSAAYALLAYQTAYLKANYPEEFMAALLSSVMSNQDKIAIYVQECREMGIEVSPPDINRSGYEFETYDNIIVFGLKAIKNLGNNTIKAIIGGRKEGSYKSLEDFLRRLNTHNVNITVIESLIKSGSLDSFKSSRAQMLLKFEDLFERINASKREYKRGQSSFFDLVDNRQDFYNNKIEFPEIKNFPLKEKLKMEKEYLGIYLSAHPLDQHRKKIKNFSNIDSSDLKNLKNNSSINICGIITNNKIHITKRNNQMSFLTIEDWKGKIEIVIFPDLFNNVRDVLSKGSMVLINAYMNDDSLIARETVNLENTFLEIKIEGDLSESELLQIKKVLRAHKRGNSPVFIRFDDYIILSGREYWQEINPQIKEKIENLGMDIAISYYK